MAKSAFTTSQFIDKLTAVDRLTDADRAVARRANREKNRDDCCRAMSAAYLVYHSLAAAVWERHYRRECGISWSVAAEDHHDNILRRRGDKYLAAMDEWSLAARRLNKAEERDFLATLKRWGRADYWNPSFYEVYKARNNAWLERHAAAKS